ncbi:alpha/beta hydrolase [Nocardioides perillae]|nr:alpha/beta hydrolase [Nocardioides perillae]
MQPRLVDVHRPRDPARAEGVVLVLHGGASRQGRPTVSPTQLSVVRMVPVARRVARAGRGRLAVHRLLNTYRGWDSEHTPVDDARAALRTLTEQYAGRPVALVGHSLGGRAALLAGQADGVASVVALNPWLYPHDDADLTGRRVLFVHGTDDRIAPAAHAESVARRLGRRADVGFVHVPGGKHAMLRQGSVFERAAADFVCATLLGDTVADGPVARVLAGEAVTSA